MIGIEAASSKPPGDNGPIHTDNHDDRFLWAVNWTWEAGGGMDYWDAAKLDMQSSIVNLDNAGLPRRLFKTTAPAAKRYSMLPNSVYLVNASEPHNGYNDNDATATRFIVSLRCAHHKGLDSWPHVVGFMADLIE